MRRWREGSGEKELRGTGAERRAWRVWRVEGVKVWGELRFVIRRVLEGGEGVMRGGMEVRERERGVEERVAGVDVGGEAGWWW